jgi:two-component system, NtrC family, sensor kinase
MIAVWLSSSLSRIRRTEFLLRDELQRAFRDLHQTQAQLLASEKALTQTQLVAALSHELNNPIGVIVSTLATQQKLVQHFEEKLPPEARNRQEISRLLQTSRDLNQACRNASQRVTDLLERLREFSHLDEAERKPIDLNGELLKALDLVIAETRSTAQIERELAELPEIVCQPQKVSMALACLLRNALQAVRDGEGLIKLSTVHLNGCVEIIIEDNGMGIDPAELKAIFDPKFVPRAGKIRTSWGLATSQQIFLQHKGQLEMQSLPGQGTRVKVTLPVS